MNPRYISYCNAHGKTPKQMMAHDNEAWPGGCMTGFILWISKCKQKFKDKYPEAFIGPTIHDQKAWTEFLSKQK